MYYLERKDLYFSDKYLYTKDEHYVKYKMDNLGYLEKTSNAMNLYYNNKLKFGIDSNSFPYNKFDCKFNDGDLFLILNCEIRSDQVFNELTKFIDELKNDKIIGIYMREPFCIQELKYLPKNIKYFIATQCHPKEVKLESKHLIMLALCGFSCGTFEIKIHYLPDQLLFVDLTNNYIIMYKTLPPKVEFLILDYCISKDYNLLITPNVKNLSLQHCGIKSIRNNYMRISTWYR